MLLHDWISVEQTKSSGVLQISDGEVFVGIVKELGCGYWADNGSFVEINNGIKIGDKILFTQHLSYEVDGAKLIRVRGRDVIEVLNAKV